MSAFGLASCLLAADVLGDAAGAEALAQPKQPDYSAFVSGGDGSLYATLDYHEAAPFQQAQFSPGAGQHDVSNVPELSGQASWLALAEGWELFVPEEGTSRLAMAEAYTFGTEVLVTGDGRAWHTASWGELTAGKPWKEDSEAPCRTCYLKQRHGCDGDEAQAERGPSHECVAYLPDAAHLQGYSARVAMRLNGAADADYTAFFVDGSVQCGDQGDGEEEGSGGPHASLQEAAEWAGKSCSTRRFMYSAAFSHAWGTKCCRPGVDDFRPNGNWNVYDAVPVNAAAAAAPPAPPPRPSGTKPRAESSTAAPTTTTTTTMVVTLPYVQHGSFWYATLDGGEPQDRTTSMDRQNGFLPVPKGWELAPADAGVAKQLGKYPWGTQWLVTSDGSAVMTSTGMLAGHVVKFGSALHTEGFEHKPNRVNVAYARVLARHPVAGAVAVVHIGSSIENDKCSGFLGRWVTCPRNAGAAGVRLNPDYPQAPDEFNVTVNEYGRVCAKRIDGGFGWVMNLSLACRETGRAMDPVGQATADEDEPPEQVNPQRDAHPIAASTPGPAPDLECESEAEHGAKCGIHGDKHVACEVGRCCSAAGWCSEAHCPGRPRYSNGRCPGNSQLALTASHGPPSRQPALGLGNASLPQRIRGSAVQRH